MTDQIFQKSKVKISSDTQIIFVADLFAEDYEGGAELTTESLILESPFKIEKVRSRDVSLELLKNEKDKFWIFGNFSGLNPQLIPTIVGNLKYSILEYDYKYCRYRSPEKHLTIEKSVCDCHNRMNGKLVSAFYYGSLGLWWMSEGQKEKYLTMFPFLEEKSNIVLSSVFDKKTLASIKALRESIRSSGEERKGWIVLGSDSWIKGAEEAKSWCEKNNKTSEVVWNLPYRETLAKLSVSEGFVYLPLGKDTCPRMVIEAKLLGCQLHLNENVQHKNEEWFATDDIASIEEYLYAAPDFFWNGIRAMMNYQPTISGYTTTYNCKIQNYPFEESISSMLQFCDEVCIIDGGSTDGTWERLIDLMMELKGIKLSDLSQEERKNALESSKSGAVCEGPGGKRIRVKQIIRDWNHPRFSVFDGLQKTEARKMCTSEFCWQMDSDEIVHESDYEKIRELVKKFPKNIDLLALPVVEFWGNEEKVRVDVNPWKWRLSRNNQKIIHGIPAAHRRYDENGELYSAGSDGCDYVDSETFEQVPFLSFYTQEVDKLRQAALSNNKQALETYKNWLNQAINQLPGVYHYSWFDIKRKIYTYKNYWSKHWTSLFNQVQEDTPENNKFFGKCWSNVTDQEIEDLSIKMKKELGGWIFHTMVDFSRPTPWVKIEKSQPEIMKNWTEGKK